MSSTNGKFKLPSIEETLIAIKKQNSQQNKIKKFLLYNTNITNTQRRAVVQLIQYYKEANNNGQAPQCTQKENQAFIAHNGPKSSELTNTHGKCEIVTKNPTRKEYDIQLMAPIITEITTEELIKEVIPQESKDSSTQTLESVENLNKHEELEEEVKYLNNIIQDQVHQIRYLKENLTTVKKELESKISDTSEMVIDYNKLIRKDYETSDSNLLKLEGKIKNLEYQLEETERTNQMELIEQKALNCKLQEDSKFWIAKSNKYVKMVTDKESQQIAKESIRVIRHQVFISLKAKHIKERSLFSKENKQQEHEKVLSLFSGQKLQDLIINKAAILYHHKNTGCVISEDDPRIVSHLLMFANIIKLEDDLQKDLHVFSLM